MSEKLSSTTIKSITGLSGERKSYINAFSDSKFELYIQSKGIVYKPVVEEGIQWETELSGSPGKLTFTVIKDDLISFHEGDTVVFKVNGTGLFYGYVFSKSRDNKECISVTAYDQLRYFKNKETYIYSNKRADELLKMIADDFKLVTGLVENTGYVIPQRIEDNSTLFDIMCTAIELTKDNTNKSYILYDNFGYLTLRDVSQMKTNLLIDADGVHDFSYGSSIDSDTYNKIQLYRDNDNGEREKYIYQDGSTISKWGILQYTDKLEDEEIPKIKGEALLNRYNKVTRTLNLTTYSNLYVRAGSSVFINLNLGDIETQTYMTAEKVVHTFKDDNCTMKLSLRGGLINDV